MYAIHIGVIRLDVSISDTEELQKRMDRIEKGGLYDRQTRIIVEASRTV